MTGTVRFNMLNEHYIQDEQTGKHLSLKDACELLNKQQVNLKKLLPGVLHPEEEVYVLTLNQLTQIIEHKPAGHMPNCVELQKMWGLD